MDKTKKSLFKNSLMLYVLLFSSYFFSLVSVPYQTRILGPDYYGRVGFAQSFMNYFKLLIDFGFILSATAEVADNRDNKEKLSEILSAVTFGKLILSGISLMILITLCIFVERFRSDMVLLILTFVSIVSGAFLPDFLYRGIEKMETITIRSVLIQAFSVGMIFIFVKQSKDYYLIPVFTALGNIVAIFGVYTHVFFKLNVRIKKVEFKLILESLKNSSYFFYSRIAGTIYSSTNTVFLGLKYPLGHNLVGYYTSSDKLITTAKSAFSPIADSLYPYMIKNKDFKLVKKILLILMPLVIFGCLIVGYFAEDVVVMFFGSSFKEASTILKIMLPIVIMTPITYILGFPVLSPMGLANHANISTIIGAIVQVLGLGILVILNKLNVYTLCYVSVLSQFVLMIYRIYIVIKNSKKYKGEGNEKNLKEPITK